MFIYHQTSGDLLLGDKHIGTGYSGYCHGKNRPDFEAIPDVGPIPVGEYSISGYYTDAKKGPLTFRLAPEKNTCTYGRSGFLIHGDSFAHPGMSSHGCIVVSYAVRQTIATSKETTIKVVR